MRISFVVANLNLSGGARVTAIYADWLASRGHDVTIIASRQRPPSLRRGLRSLMTGHGWPFSKSDRTHYAGSRARLVELKTPRPVVDSDVPEGDLVIASWWECLDWVSALSLSKGKKISFLQGYELHSGPFDERIKKVWRLPFPKIVVSQWLENVAREQFGDDNVFLVPNGVNLGQFNADRRNRQRRPTVGMLYSPTPFKGCDITLRAIEFAQRQLPDLHLVAFGANEPDDTLPLPLGAEFHLRPGPDTIRDIYAKCDAWLFGSRSEGFGLPILESMACRTPVIGTPAGAAPELLADGRGVLVPFDDPSAMGEAILGFFSMTDGQWLQMSDAAFQEASRHDWERSCVMFEEALEAIVARK